MSDHFNQLSASKAITLDGKLITSVGGYSVGAITPIAEDESQAQTWIQDSGLMSQISTDSKIEVMSVGDPYTFMRRAAGEGIAGIQWLVPKPYLAQFMFMVRVEEAGAQLPTVLTAVPEEGWGPSLTLIGERNIDHADLLHWTRYDILDSVSGRWGVRCPFRHWEHGEDLYEIKANGVLVLLGDVGLLGDWNSPDGAVAFFTTKESAEHYLHHHLAAGPNQYLFHDSTTDRKTEDIFHQLSPQPVSDLSNRLTEIKDVNPFVAWCINPLDHRENSSCGRFDLSATDGDDSHRMSAVSGIWKVLPHNQFELEVEDAPWSGTNTIKWSTTQSIQLLPLERSFCDQLDVTRNERSGGISDAELEELVSDYLNTALDKETHRFFDRFRLESEDVIDKFYVIAWDTITGDGAETPLVFDCYFEALRELANFEREHDRKHRETGASSCFHLGFQGSSDQEFEDKRSYRFNLGLNRLVLRVLKQGYHPDDASSLVALCNAVLPTLHVEYAGYAKDLLWASTAEQRDEILDQLDISHEAWEQWQNSVEPILDPQGKKLAVERMGTENWECLNSRVKHFLTTALLHYETCRGYPQIDFAPISIEVVKGLEVELGELLTHFKSSIDKKDYEHETGNYAEVSLQQFINGGKPPSLGMMSHLFRQKEKCSTLHRLFHQYLSNLPNYKFLTSGAFAKKGLQRVINKYRNGGAHDSRISEDICKECISDLIGFTGQPGYIEIVASWKLQ